MMIVQEVFSLYRFHQSVILCRRRRRTFFLRLLSFWPFPSQASKVSLLLVLLAWLNATWNSIPPPFPRVSFVNMPKMTICIVSPALSEWQTNYHLRTNGAPCNSKYCPETEVAVIELSCSDEEIKLVQRLILRQLYC